jgi:hypothetical protein
LRLMRVRVRGRVRGRGEKDSDVRRGRNASQHGEMIKVILGCTSCVSGVSDGGGRVQLEGGEAGATDRSCGGGRTSSAFDQLASI